ncbi:putative rhomboid family membrane protein [Zalerion maritima]|uniref:Rhomboid family membrane protein n=1 Tax=Zalerion maritima TaxID=339359 RepID=A0AAD5WUC1_9PEZI|nr:putative rhomboid family membrane protein [Zalerion maritima]
MADAGDDDHNAPPQTHYWGFIPVPKTETTLVMHKCLLVSTVLSAGTLLLPPRTMGRQLILGGYTTFGINWLRYDWTGKTWSERTDPEVVLAQKMNIVALPEGAKAAQDQIRREKELRRIRRIEDEKDRNRELSWFIEREKELKRIDRLEGEEKKLAQYMLRVREAEEADKRGEGKEYGYWKRLWMGGEKEGWELRRWKEHREILERGDGIWGAIKNDIGEAWDMAKKKEPEKEQEGKERKESKEENDKKDDKKS